MSLVISILFHPCWFLRGVRFPEVYIPEMKAQTVWGGFRVGVGSRVDRKLARVLGWV